MWHDLLGAALAFMVVCWVAALALKRWALRIAAALRLAAGLVGRLAVGGVFVAVAAGAVGRGGYWLFLTAVFCLLALVSFGLAGVTIFVLVRDATIGARSGSR
jgi:hypothetical protein